MSKLSSMKLNEEIKFYTVIHNEGLSGKLIFFIKVFRRRGFRQPLFQKAFTTVHNEENGSIPPFKCLCKTELAQKYIFLRLCQTERLFPVSICPIASFNGLQALLMGYGMVMGFLHSMS